MKKITAPKMIVLIGIVAMMMAASSAFAGKIMTGQTTHVFSSGTNTYAHGVLSHTRASSNTVEYIGCVISNGTYASCSAVDPEGEQLYCTTTNAAKLEIIRSIKDNTRLYLSANADGECSGIYTYYNSYFMP